MPFGKACEKWIFFSHIGFQKIWLESARAGKNVAKTAVLQVKNVAKTAVLGVVKLSFLVIYKSKVHPLGRVNCT